MHATQLSYYIHATKSYIEMRLQVSAGPVCACHPVSKTVALMLIDRIVDHGSVIAAPMR